MERPTTSRMLLRLRFGYSADLAPSGRAFVGEATSYTDEVGEPVTRVAVRLDPVSCP